MTSLISKLKELAKRSPVPLSKNHLYDMQTRRIIRRVLKEGSCCVDVGCHKGEILDLIIDMAPNGMHYGFEPIPEFYQGLVAKYSSFPNVHIKNIAASDVKGTSKFNFVKSNPSYSGLKKRDYDRQGEVDEQIEVHVDLIDNVIPGNIDIHLIKIDVEGAELLVLKGAVDLLNRCRPTIIFEHGLGASDKYNTEPGEVFDFLASAGLNVSTLNGYLHGHKVFSRSEFERQYFDRVNYYFVAFP